MSINLSFWLTAGSSFCIHHFTYARIYEGPPVMSKLVIRGLLVCAQARLNVCVFCAYPWSCGCIGASSLSVFLTTGRLVCASV